MNNLFCTRSDERKRGNSARYDVKCEDDRGKHCLVRCYMSMTLIAYADMRLCDNNTTTSATLATKLQVTNSRMQNLDESLLSTIIYVL